MKKYKKLRFFICGIGIISLLIIFFKWIKSTSKYTNNKIIEKFEPEEEKTDNGLINPGIRARINMSKMSISNSTPDIGDKVKGKFKSETIYTTKFVKDEQIGKDGKTITDKETIDKRTSMGERTNMNNRSDINNNTEDNDNKKKEVELIIKIIGDNIKIDNLPYPKPSNN